jgi:hypothetical protein
VALQPLRLHAAAPADQRTHPDPHAPYLRRARITTGPPGLCGCRTGSATAERRRLRRE